MTRNAKYRAFFTVMAFLWFVAMSVVIVIQQDRIERLEAVAAALQQTPAPDVEILETVLNQLNQRIIALENRPASPTQNEQEALQNRLTQFENSLKSLEQHIQKIANQDELSKISQRLDQLQSDLEASRQKAQMSPVVETGRPSAPVAAKPQTLTPSQSSPPFQVLGTDMRGGETFVVVAPLKNATLSQVKLLRPGDTEQGWVLKNFTGSKVTFAYNNRTRVLPLPTA